LIATVFRIFLLATSTTHLQLKAFDDSLLPSR
jgi:hypothetical protein